MEFDTFLESVVDGTDRFKAKRSSDFRDKLQGVVDDIPNAFAKQDELEKHVADELARIKSVSDAAMKKHALELAPIRKDYQNGTPLIELLYYESDPHDEHYALAKAFVDKHGKEVMAAIEAELKALKELAAWSAEQKWPTGAGSLTRYTRYGYALHLINHSVLPAIKRLMHTTK